MAPSNAKCVSTKFLQAKEMIVQKKLALQEDTSVIADLLVTENVSLEKTTTETKEVIEAEGETTAEVEIEADDLTIEVEVAIDSKGVMIEIEVATAKDLIENMIARK